MPTEVKGQSLRGGFEILSGLKEGEEVVTSGNFLTDSDSRLKAGLGMMGPGH